MSIANYGDSSSSRLGGFPYWGNRSRISWGAVLAGAAVAAATSVLLSLLGAAFGAGSISNLGNLGNVAGGGPGAGVGAAGLWTMIDLFVSMLLGGYVASRLSGTHSHLDGELHGITMWAVAALFGLLAFANAIGGWIEGSGIGSAVGTSLSHAVGAPSGGIATATGANPQAAIDRLAASLGSSGDPTTMSHDQIGAEIRSLLGGGDFLTRGALSDADRARLVSLVAAQYGITRDEATQRVGRIEAGVKTRLAEADQRVRALADEVADGAQSAARALFTSLVLGLLGALIGAWLGTRHKRILHPHETQIPVAPATAPSYAYTHVTHEPTTHVTTVYEDTGRLVSQYLRGVSFPTSKQDLLRYARAGNAGSDVIHTIEGLADRSYVSVNDVLAALELVH